MSPKLPKSPKKKKKSKDDEHRTPKKTGSKKKLSPKKSPEVSDSDDSSAVKTPVRKKKQLLRTLDLSESEAESDADLRNARSTLKSGEKFVKKGMKKYDLSDSSDDDDILEKIRNSRKGRAKDDDDDDDESDDESVKEAKRLMKAAEKVLKAAKLKKKMKEANQSDNDSSGGGEFESPRKSYKKSKAVKSSKKLKTPKTPKTPKKEKTTPKKEKTPTKSPSKASKTSTKELEKKKQDIANILDSSSESEVEVDKSKNTIAKYGSDRSLSSKSEDSASSSDSVSTDEDDRQRKNKAVPFVAYERQKKITLEQPRPLEKKPHNLDPSRWKNPLKDWKALDRKDIKSNRTELSITFPPHTDLWRKTRYGFSKDNVDYYSEKIVGDFECFVKISGNFSDSHQKAGILIRVEENEWLFAGMEYLNGRAFVSILNTRDYTDHSLQSLPLNADHAGIWINLKRINNIFEAYHSVNGTKWLESRIGPFTERKLVSVGVTGAAPTGKGLIASFDYFTCIKKGSPF